MKRAIPETAIGAAVVAWLVADGWDVYQEVACRGGVADIVAVAGPVIWAIELKASFTFDVFEQAMGWRGRANVVSIAVPSAGGRRSGTARQICADYGIGLIEVNHDRSGVPRDVHQREPGALRRLISPSLRAALRPEQKLSHAGAAGGGHWTPFRDTCSQLARAVARVPGVPLKTAIAEIKHHYASSASARAALVHWISEGRVPGVRLVRDGRSLTLFPNT